MLAEPAPSGNLALKAVWHYARGMAFQGKGNTDDAEVELGRLIELSATEEVRVARAQANPAPMVVTIARNVLAGEIAAKKGYFDKAVSHLDTAVRYEDGLVYTEPSDWSIPVRQSLGAVLLEAGRAFEAEVVYWEDLRKNPDNGWSLFGLLQALRAQGKKEQAKEIEKRFEKAWSRADVVLTSSRF
jgi:tetratricopeptide (TPR) repeat protein